MQITQLNELIYIYQEVKRKNLIKNDALKKERRKKYEFSKESF